MCGMEQKGAVRFPTEMLLPVQYSFIVQYMLQALRQLVFTRSVVSQAQDQGRRGWLVLVDPKTSHIPASIVTVSGNWGSSNPQRLTMARIFITVSHVNMYFLCHKLKQKLNDDV